jgi:hypothetical protein
MCIDFASVPALKRLFAAIPHKLDVLIHD